MLNNRFGYLYRFFSQSFMPLFYAVSLCYSQHILLPAIKHINNLAVKLNNKKGVELGRKSVCLGRHQVRGTIPCLYYFIGFIFVLTLLHFSIIRLLSCSYNLPAFQLVTRTHKVHSNCSRLLPQALNLSVEDKKPSSVSSEQSAFLN